MREAEIGDPIRLERNARLARVLKVHDDLFRSARRDIPSARGADSEYCIFTIFLVIGIRNNALGLIIVPAPAGRPLAKVRNHASF
jgi:hypothetical protein